MTTLEKYNGIFPTRLREVMKEQRITITALAKELNVSRQTVSLYYNGSMEPNIERIRKISRYLGISVDYLLGLSDTRATDTNIRAVSEFTGLSEKSIESLERMKESDRHFLNQGHKERLILPTLNAILGHPEFAQFMELVRQFLVYRDVPDYGGYGTSVEDEKKGLVLIGSTEYSELCRFRAMGTLERILLDVWNHYQEKQEIAGEEVQEAIKLYKQLEQEKESGEDGPNHKEN